MNRTPKTSLVACALIAVLALPSRVSAQDTTANSAQNTADIWRAFTTGLEPGRRLKLRLKTGLRFKATLLQTLDEGVTVQPRSRAAVPPQYVPFDAIETLEIDRDTGIGTGKAVAIGAGVAAGAWLALMALTFAIWAD